MLWLWCQSWDLHVSPAILFHHIFPHSLHCQKNKTSLKFWFQNSGCFFVNFAFLLFAFVWFKWCLSACVTILFCFCVVFCDMCSSRQRICALQTWNCLRVRTKCLLRVRKVRLFQRENSKFYNLIFLSKKRNALPALSGKLLLVSIVNKKYNFNSCFI